ncbi:inositol monophosphatase [Arsenicitalea aurantiaca]|uniref:Inositol monophosphatase n=1 Tax=Arsenicitalea aurantiaca TaxID=1783274 RepID=A0A433XGA2_9HYPH|nr:inositol monophosphatase family protein [Arsenicitalea aurantiaca]RUT33096.1 inositol monophosphatase [Arsenicitalea aurantiaca]
MMAIIDVPALATILRDAAKAEILPRFRRLDAGMVRQKSEAIDLVTEADVASERAIAAAVADAMPEALFVGEEGVAADPGLLERLAAAELAIVVDPIDGTANFAAGLPLFAVMAAVVHRGETVAGIIYDPMGDDWVMAEKGAGAWMRRPDGTDERLNAAAAVPLEQMIGSVSIAYLPQDTKAAVLGNLAKVRLAANYRVAGHDYRLFAAGHTHFVMFNKLMPWDHLGGTLIAQEAGAHVARLDGSPYQPHHLTGGLLLAPDPDSWALLRHEVFTV